MPTTLQNALENFLRNPSSARDAAKKAAGTGAGIAISDFTVTYDGTALVAMATFTPTGVTTAALGVALYPPNPPDGTYWALGITGTSGFDNPNGADYPLQAMTQTQLFNPDVQGNEVYAIALALTPDMILFLADMTVSV